MKNLSYRKVGDKLHITVNVHDPEAFIAGWDQCHDGWKNPRDFFLYMAGWFTPDDELQKSSEGWSELVNDLVDSDLDAIYPPSTKWVLGLDNFGENVASSCSPQVCFDTLSNNGWRKFDVDGEGNQIATFAPPNVPAA